MIGSRVASRPPSPRRALVCLAGAAVIAVLGVAAGLPLIVPIAVWPAAVGLCLLLVGERRFDARFMPDAVDVARPRQRFPYASILEVRPAAMVSAGTPSFPIHVVHERGSLLIPARLTVPSERVYAFLRGFVAERPPRALPPDLEAYRLEQEGSFGADRVWCCAGSRAGRPPRVHDLRALAAGFSITAVLWLILAWRRPSEPGWWFAGAVAGVIGAGLFGLDVLHQRRAVTVGRPAPAAASALVISPLGLAVHQGPVSGHLTWQEIRKVTLRTPGARLFEPAANVAGLALEVEGTTILLTDSYDRPLADIHTRILRYWR